MPIVPSDTWGLTGGTARACPVTTGHCPVCTTDSTITNTIIWQGWTTVSTAITMTYSNDIWNQWNATAVYEYVNDVRDHGQSIRAREQAVELTDEQKAAREAATRLQRAHAAERKAARERAQALFEEMLTPSQQAEIGRHQYFTVEGSHSKRRYRVRLDAGKHGNILELDEKGVAVRSLCCAPGGDIPEMDAILGQKLFLEMDEQAFLKAANVTELRRTA